MSLEAQLLAVLGPLVGGRAYPDVTPDKPVFPLIVYQGAGGQEQWYVERKRREKQHQRVQVFVWAATRAQASGIAYQIGTALCESDFPAVEPYGSPTSLYEEAIKKYGTRQDFGIWFLPT
ncbi:MAG: hypothetical protein K0S02_3915 [Achromobacter mucicolens]|jgi:hypothetical protein|uniref:DUF3168 domain-containing protein n=1 Tax=Achromobacter mucicolens TaxID=1389922 RepID=UPI00242B7D28|nr:DUF3168 domain-containing protein [Achromobacter mucicolens]MDF2863643.1 hypothetical protein [Achromobacter mucicolens]